MILRGVGIDLFRIIFRFGRELSFLMIVKSKSKGLGGNHKNQRRPRQIWWSTRNAKRSHSFSIFLDRVKIDFKIKKDEVCKFTLKSDGRQLQLYRDRSECKPMLPRPFNKTIRI